MQANTTDKRKSGSTFVETAFVFSVFAFMLIGILDFGQFLFIHQALVERARNAARWGVIHDPTDHVAIRNMVLYNRSQPSDEESSYFGLTPSMVQVTDPGSGTNDYRLVVLVTNYPYTMQSPLIRGNYNGPNITVISPIGQ